MAKLYDRACELVIGPRSQDGLKLTGLRVVFNIEKTLDKTPNNATIEIYNLKSASRSFIESEKTSLILDAGYKDNLKTIFIGDIAQVTTKRNGPDIITSIEAADAGINYTTKSADLSFASGSRFKQVFDTIADRFGVTLGEIDGVNENDQFLQGLTLTGMIKDHLDMLTKRQGLEWSIQDNKLQILSPTNSTSEEAVILKSETGLIGSPFKTKIVNQSLLTKKDGKSAENGVEILSLLNPEIRPGRAIVLTSDLVKGQFRCQKVKHMGDTHGNPWYSQLEVK